MSEYYDHYHRWEPLAEFHFNLNESDEEYDDDNYLYCLCSRAYIRDGVKPYNVDKEYGSESDVDVVQDNSQGWENESHVHFSLDTSYKVKCEKDEGASCYCSASHTDNCCSTDEHDAALIHGNSHILQPSDSGADLTYQDCHSEHTNPDKLERMEQDIASTENYLSEATWDKFWAVNGERLIWASWIKKYSDYINPAYLDQNNDLIVDDSNIPKQRSVDQIYKEAETKIEDDMRERKFSYDSKVNPYKKNHAQKQAEKVESNENKDEAWLPSNRRRSCSEHERILSPRTLAGTDSMTNVTKITLSSYDVTSSHVTSESTPTDDYSVSSSTSDDQSNDQTRIANIDNAEPNSIEDMDSDQYWQFLWKKHFGEQYALHYANYIVSHKDKDTLPCISIELTNPKDNESKSLEVLGIHRNEKSEVISNELVINNTMLQINNQMEMQTQMEELKTQVKDAKAQVVEAKAQVLEVKTEMEELKTQVEEIKTKVQEIQLLESEEKPKKRKKKSNKILGSVGVLLQNLLKDSSVCDNSNENQVMDAGEGNGDKNDKQQNSEVKSENNDANSGILQQSVSNANFASYSYDDGDDEPPEETPITLKRSHEIDHEEAAAEKIKATFEMMGFSIEGNDIPKGQMVFRKRMTKLRPPRYKSNKRFVTSRKTYFDDDGNPINEQSKDFQDDKGIQTDEELPCPDFRSEARRLLGSLEQNYNMNQSLTLTNDNDKNATQDGKVEMSESMNIDISEPLHKSNEEKYAEEITNAINVSTNDRAKVDNVMCMSIDTNCSDKSKPNLSENVNNASTVEHKNINKSENDLKEAEDVKEIDGSKCIDYNVQFEVEKVNDDIKAIKAAEMPLPDDLEPSSDEKQENAVTQNMEGSKKRRRQKRYTKLDEEMSNVPEELKNDPKMMKYWKKRHSLFHRFDEGIRLDHESWFSVTPENVARHIARKYTYDTVLDAFCGAGGNTIQFAFTSKKVIAIDIDPAKVEMARHNASVYGVENRIQFIVGDFFQLAPTLSADMVFLSPPWGGPGYSSNAQYDIETMLEPRPATELMSVARTISPNISLYLPRNTRPDQILSLAKEVGGSVEVEQSFLDKRFVAITAYYY